MNQPRTLLPVLSRVLGRAPALSLFLSAAFAGVSAHAQAIKIDFSVQRFDPAPGPRNFFTTRGLRTEGQMAWSAGLVVNYKD